MAIKHDIECFLIMRDELVNIYETFTGVKTNNIQYDRIELICRRLEHILGLESKVTELPKNDGGGA